MMYAERELMFSSFQNFSPEVNQLDYFCRYHKSHFPLGNLVQTSTISEYDLGGEGDLFKAPEAIIEEPAMGFDPMTAAMSMISCGENMISPQSLKVANIESIQSEQLLSEVFYECKRDILAKDAIETPLSEVLDIKIPALGTVETPFAENRLITPGSFPRSVSSECLSSMDWMHGSSARPDFLDFHGMDLGDMYGMRRSFSEGDIKTLGNGPLSLMHSPRTLPQIFSNCTTEDRQQKLSRYRNKKSKRNFGRKIKYACRKALADTQPRIRGRFAKTEESDGSKNFITVRP